MIPLLAAACALTGGAAPGEPLGGEQPLLTALAAQVSADQLKATDTRLVGFGTRHSLSDTVSDTRGIGAARRWVAGQFTTLSQACGGCIVVDTPSQDFTGPRVPTPTAIVDVVAIQKGTTDPERIVVISAHIDSLMSDFLDGKSDAPGANDDGSGVSAVMEAARVLSAHKFPATIVYAVLQTIAFSLYLYSAELYPTRLRAIGTGFGSAWLRAGSSIGPAMVGLLMADFGIRYVFAAFAAVAVAGGVITLLFAIETKGQVLEELSP